MAGQSSQQPVELQTACMPKLQDRNLIQFIVGSSSVFSEDTVGHRWDTAVVLAATDAKDFYVVPDATEDKVTSLPKTSANLAPWFAVQASSFSETARPEFAETATSISSYLTQVMVPEADTGLCTPREFRCLPQSLD